MSSHREFPVCTDCPERSAWARFRQRRLEASVGLLCRVVMRVGFVVCGLSVDVGGVHSTTRFHVDGGWWVVDLVVVRF